MVMRMEVDKLLKLGPLPSVELADEKKLNEYEELIKKISEPLTDEEACALTSLFGADDCFGLAWSLLHLIETAPGWPVAECLHNTSNEWISRLRDRAGMG